MAKKICLISTFICILEKKSRIRFRYEKDFYLLRKVENRYDLYLEKESNPINSFYNNPYDFFKLVKINNKSIFEVYENFEILDNTFGYDSQVEHGYSFVSISRFIDLDYAFLRYKNKKYFYFKKGGNVHFNCIYPVESYSEKTFKETEFKEALVIDGEAKKFSELFSEVIIEQINIF